MTSKFKVGQKVRRLKDSIGGTLKAGEIYEVDCVGVRSGNLHIKGLSGYWFPQYFEPVDDNNNDNDPTTFLNPLEYYNKLIDAVREIDKEAADYLEFEAPKLRDWSPSRNLSGVMYWKETPQGGRYWANIYDDLYAVGYYDYLD